MKFRIQEITDGVMTYFVIQKKKWFGWYNITLAGNMIFYSFELAESTLNKYFEIEKRKSVKTIKEYIL